VTILGALAINASWENMHRKYWCIMNQVP